jgi:VCBS repeat-containing protein
VLGLALGSLSNVPGIAADRLRGTLPVAEARAAGPAAPLAPPFELERIEIGGVDSSPDGRFIVSSGPNAAGNYDVVLLDRANGRTTLISVSPSGASGDGWDGDPSVSADGRYVAFASNSSNLVPGDTNDANDVFVRDVLRGVTKKITVPPRGGQIDNNSYSTDISDDGRYVAFFSHATNLVPGDTNGEGDIFVHDRRTGRTQRASVSSLGLQSGGAGFWTLAISGDGRYVVFTSGASDLVLLDTNLAVDVFVRDLRDGTTERVSISTRGRQGNDGSGLDVDISRDGRFVAFQSHASNLVPRDTNRASDIFIRDRVEGMTTRVSVSSSEAQANNVSQGVALSDDGLYVAFDSVASNLSRPDIDTDDTITGTDVFVRDVRAGTTVRVSMSETGEQPDAGAGLAFITGNGRYVGFGSAATNLIPGDPAGQSFMVPLYLADLTT